MEYGDTRGALGALLSVGWGETFALHKIAVKLIEYLNYYDDTYFLHVREYRVEVPFKARFAGFKELGEGIILCSRTPGPSSAINGSASSKCSPA